MAIFEATATEGFPASSRKYEDFQFFSPQEFLTAGNNQCGTCTSLYFQSLLDRGLIPPTLQYLEIPLGIADSHRSLEDYTPEELWDLAYDNYRLLLRDETGGDGQTIKGWTLDKFIDAFIKQNIVKKSRVLDLGCSDGSLLKKLDSFTPHAYGLELCKSSHLTQDLQPDRIRVGSLTDAPILFPDLQFDWVVANLLLQWIPSLEDSARVLNALLVKGGKLLVTMTTPEFTKNGDWIQQGDQYDWVITKSLRRRAEIVMLNRMVGPLWMYPRTTIDYLQAFGQVGLCCVGGSHIYLDTYLSQEERTEVLQLKPYLIRHEKLPAFTTLIFEKR